MIISVGNPRDPVRSGEYVMFMCLISIGFFFGSDLILGMTEVTIPFEEERSVQTLDDVRANNVTLTFYVVSRLFWTDKELSSFKHKEIGDDFGSARKLYKHVKDMLKYQNLSTSMRIMNLMDVPVPQRISIRGKIYARLSFFKETSIVDDQILAVWQRNRPWSNRLNNNLLKFHEYGLKQHPCMSYEKYNMYYRHFGYYCEDFAMKESKKEEDSLIEEVQEYYLMIIGTSTFIPFLLLLFEMYFFHNKFY